MNILIPHRWLLDHLDTKATVKDIQKYVSLSGPTVETIFQREGDSVYDVEVTTNRVDSMSVRGVAREAAVILTSRGKPSSLKPLKMTPKMALKTTLKSRKLRGNNSLPLPKITNDPKLSKRILCVVLRDVQHTLTPEWMAKRLRQTEMNVHHAAIDITNYITHDLGHPCHAFDYDKIMALGGEIIVKLASKGKKFTTLDGEKYKTVGGEIVFENARGEIIDLPAIKGTLNTAVDDHTKNILFWIESADAKKIRFASMSHAIRTMAAQLNEKHVDPYLADSIFQKGIQLYQELCNAKIASKIYDEFPNKPKVKPITIKIETIENYLGVKIALGKIKKILNALDCRVKLRDNKLVVTPPTFRPDLQIPADIVEEVARIYGYHNLPSKLMATPIPLTRPADANFRLEERIKHFLVDIGWQEVYTYSMVSEELALQSGHKIKDHLKLQNPLTDDRVYLRRSILPSLQEVVDENPQRSQLSVFEIANLYPPVKGDIPENTQHLSLVSSKNYRQVRGDLESLLESLFITDYSITPLEKPSDQFTQEATVEVKKQKLGKIGILKSGRVGVGINLKQLLAVAATHPTYQPIAKTNIIHEDLTFTFPKRIAIGETTTFIAKFDKLIKRVSLSGDIYKENHTVTISYHDPERNITSEELEPLRKKIVDAVEKKFRAQLVGKL